MDLPPEAVPALEKALRERYRDDLRPGESLRVSLSTEGPVVKAAFVLEGGQDGARVVMESWVQLADVRDDPEEAIDVAVSSLDLLFQEYFASERSLRFSGVREGRDLKGVPLQVRQERTFPDLEAQANALLGESGDD